MARIAGIDLPREKRIEIGLTYIYGIGRTSANKILAKAGVNPDTRVKDLTEEDEAKLREVIHDYTVEGDLRRNVAMDIKRLTEIGCSHPELVKRLFEAEVTEVKDGVVEIMSIAREAGSRSKIAVLSHNPDVDPVGACVGLNGARVNAIVSELRGEKIDIINWSDNPAVLIENALSPAKVISVVADADERSAKVVVPDYQLSLAIGKEGQNARLAARLTGFKIDIKSESQAGENGDLYQLENNLEEEYPQDLDIEQEEYTEDLAAEQVDDYSADQDMEQVENTEDQVMEQDDIYMEELDEEME